MEKNFLVGKFWNTEHVLDAVKKFQEKDILVYDVYSPFPIHGIEPYLNIRRSRLAIAAFLLGLTGATVGYLHELVFWGDLAHEHWGLACFGIPRLCAHYFRSNCILRLSWYGADLLYCRTVLAWQKSEVV